MPIRIASAAAAAGALLFTAACARQRSNADTTAANSQPPVARANPAEWFVTPEGLGPLHAGMDRTQAEAVVGGSLVIRSDTDWNHCGYLPTDRLPAGVRVMVEGGTIARVEIDSGEIATAAGARIGDSEDRVRSLYPGRVVVTPRKYAAGHTLTIRPAAGQDTLFRLVFETDSGRVQLYRAGRVPPVEYVEGCG